MTTPPLFPGFDGLMTLSRREGVDIRPTLLRVLTDLYVQASAHSDDEERQFVELTSRLIDQVDDATRAAVRARLAIYPGDAGRNPGQARAAALASRSARAARPRDCRARLPAAPPVKAPSEAQLRMASNLSMQPNDAAEISDMFFARQRQRARPDPAQSCRHAVEGFGANSRRARGARDRDAGDGRVRRRRRKLHPRTRRGPDPAVRGSPTQVVNDPGGEPLACAAKALDMPSAGFPAGVAVPQSGIRLLGAQRLPAVAAVRPAERAIRPGHAGRVARLDHGGHPRQVPRPRSTTTNAIARAPATRPDAPGGAPPGAVALPQRDERARSLTGSEDA